MQPDIREALAQFALDQLRDALIVLGPDGSVLEVNRSARAHELDVVSLFEGRDSDARLLAFVEELRASREAMALVASAKGKVYRLDGTRVGGLSIVVVREASGPDQRRPDEQLEKTRFRASVGDVAATMVHDFNNVLTPILITSARLARELDGGSLAPMANMIHESASLATVLARDLLALAKHEPPMVQPFEINDAIIDLRPLLERLLGEDVELDVSLEPEAGAAMVNRKRLEHALLNLVVNARDALPNGGRITIRTKAIDDENRPRLMLSVSDTGVGMTSHVRAHAFDGFFTTKAESGGLGLGLTSVRHFAADSHADIAIESEPMNGTTVTMLFDRLRSDPVALARSDPSLPRGGAGEVVLVADRHESVRGAMKVALENAGYTVVLAATQAGAAERVASERIDIAIIDDRLVGRDGGAFLRRLRESRPELRLVIMCDGSDDDVSGSAALLQKAFSDEDLLRTTREALDAAAT